MRRSDADRRRWLIGYEPAGDGVTIQISLAGQLGRGGSELLEACCARIRVMSVSRVLLDLSALAGGDEAGAGCLAAACRALGLRVTRLRCAAYAPRLAPC